MNAKNIKKEEQRYRFVYCVHCRYDVEDQEGWKEAEDWTFCPHCGTRLVRRQKPDYVPRWGINKDGLWFRKEVKKEENNGK